MNEDIFLFRVCNSTGQYFLMFTTKTFEFLWVGGGGGGSLLPSILSPSPLIEMDHLNPSSLIIKLQKSRFFFSKKKKGKSNQTRLCEFQLTQLISL